MQVLVDADNVSASRLRLVCAAVVDAQTTGNPDVVDSMRFVAAGRSHAIDAVDWPSIAELVRIAGWQEADMALASAYVPDREPLLLVTGDGDFGLLAGRHPGPVLIVSAAASGRLREAARVIDPAVDGGRELREWLASVTSRSSPSRRRGGRRTEPGGEEGE